MTKNGKKRKKCDMREKKSMNPKKTVFQIINQIIIQLNVIANGFLFEAIGDIFRHQGHKASTWLSHSRTCPASQKFRLIRAHF
jgi:hypothetical protein